MPLRPDDTLDLGEFVPFYIRAIANRLAQAASRLYSAQFGLGLTEWSCLAALGVEENVSASRICEISGFDKALISRSVNALERKQLVETRPVEDHNRRRLIAFTPEGRQTYDEVRKLALVREDRLLQGLSTAERAQLRRFLKIMQRNANALASEPAGTR